MKDVIKSNEDNFIKFVNDKKYLSDKEYLSNKEYVNDKKHVNYNKWHGRFLAVLFILIVSSVLISYADVYAADDSVYGRGIQTPHKSDMVYDASTGYYLETITTTDTYYDAATGCNVTKVETVYNYYNYDGYKYELVMSNKNTENTYTPVNPAATPGIYDSPAPAQTANPYDSIYAQPTQIPVYDDYYNQLDAIDFDTSPLKISVKRNSSKKAIVKWKVNDNAHGYYIFRAASEEGKYKKIADVDDYSVNEYTDKKLKSGKMYYYKLQAYYETDAGTLTTDMSDAEQVSTFKTQQLKNKLKKIKKKYPDGKYWNHVGYKVSTGQSTYGYVTNSPCRHGGTPNGVANTCNKYSVMLDGKVMTGYQCYGFANLIGDKLFGRSRIKTHKSYKKSKVGDHVRYGGHSVVVIEKHAKYIKVAECNIGGTCMIKWGRKISKSALKKATYYTRY